MPAASTDQRALELVRQLRQAGEIITRIVVDGRKIEIELADMNKPQKIDEVKW
uniref:hypothetical protein n=1 Tax=Roseovarius sp. BRH_c41 TaxID=1629709 RepID=UPI000B2D756F|nr:hypothetical protein [Roseovarius sp. BRH_c41]